jgi:hypothetical protein
MASKGNPLRAAAQVPLGHLRGAPNGAEITQAGARGSYADTPSGTLRTGDAALTSHIREFYADRTTGRVCRRNADTRYEIAASITTACTLAGRRRRRGRGCARRSGSWSRSRSARRGRARREARPRPRLTTIVGPTASPTAVARVARVPGRIFRADATCFGFAAPTGAVRPLGNVADLDGARRAGDRRHRPSRDQRC